MARVRFYSKNEELANTLSHALGIVMGLFCGSILIRKALENNSKWALFAVIVYLIGMFSCYVSSTLYHASTNEVRKGVFRRFDHAAIFLHIAGTYTPLTLITLRETGAWGWSIFATVWLFALVGSVLSFQKLKEHSNLKTISYVLMGCTILIAFKPLIQVLGETDRMTVLYWIIAGGVSYIIGAIFYSLAKIKYMHTVFHFFVLGGSVCHIIAIYFIL